LSNPRAIILAPRAARDLEKASAWWADHRPAVPHAFKEELERALALISTHPWAGAKATNVKLRGVRRVHLSRIHYHLYYRLSVDGKTVEVLANWHASRGSGPSL
jgi:plasmid stabilization system protein ParE